MPHEAQFAEVASLIEQFGPRATLVTVTEGSRPHVVTAMIRAEGERLVADVGPSTRANVVDRPGVALVWQPDGEGEYQLIVDGIAEDVTDAATLRIRVVGGILHRLAGLPDGPPSCLSLGAQ